MKILITGGSACGKSTFAEKLAMGLRNGSGSGDRYNEGKLIYLAAMKPYGPESERRIARHRMLRDGKGFETFVKDGDKVKVSVRFRGREMGHTEMGKIVIDDFIKIVGDAGTIEKAAKLEGRNMIMFLAPKSE